MNRIIHFASFVVTLTSTLADDWSSWLGPTADSVFHESGTVTEIPAGGLKAIWEAPVHMGYSGPSVADGKVFFMDYIRISTVCFNRSDFKISRYPTYLWCFYIWNCKVIEVSRYKRSLYV